MIDIEYSNRQSKHRPDRERIVAAVKQVLEGEGVSRAAISVAVVDDPTIHQLNRRHLDHDYPTDVLSFVFADQEDSGLEGEIIVSADTAATRAAEFDWTAEDELLLYVVHGALHLTGYDDATDQQREQMRRLESHYLASFGLKPRYRERPAATAGEEGPA